jgi:hypothetical protein
MAFFKDPEPLDWLIGYATFDTGRYNRKKIDIVNDSRYETLCEEYFNTDSIILEPIQNRNYPPELLRDIMLAMAFFDTKAKHEESCDWLCGKSRSWRLRKLPVDQHFEYSQIRKKWLFDVSSGFEELPERGCDQVDHGDEGLDVSVSARPGSGGFEDAVQGLQACVAVS